MSLERNTVVDRILQSIDHGRLPPAQTEQRLHALIEQETDRTDGPADTALIDGCLALLEQLHAPAKAPDVPERPARRFVRVCKWAAVAAAVILLVLGVTDNLHWQWYDHGTSADGEQHIITGHEVKVDVIQKAIAELQDGAQSFRFTSVADMEHHLGFNPGIPDRLADAYEPASIDVSVQSDRIMFLVAYRSDAEPEGSISLNVGCYVNLNDVSVAVEPAEVGEICLIGGCSVYVSRGTDHDVAQWMNGNTCFVLRTAQNAASVTDHVREIIGCGFAPDSSTGITAEQIAASIQRNMTYDMQPLQTEDFGALCEYLGFVPDLIQPEAIGADSVCFSASTTPAFLRIVVHYRDTDENTMIHFSGAYYSSMEEAIFAFEESKEGEFIQIGGRSVYTTMNFSRRVYSWTEDLSICYISTQMNHDDVVAVLEDYFAGRVIRREEKLPVTGVTAEQIAASIQRNMNHAADQLKTEDFGELCDSLGFVPDLIRPEVIGADRVIFTGDAARFFLQVNASYLDADGKTMALFDSMYYSSMEEARYAFEESETGEFIQVGKHSVYSTKNYSWQVYSWTEGIRVCSIATRMDHDDVLVMLEDYFAGRVIEREEKLPVTGVTVEEIWDSAQKLPVQERQHLRTSDYAKVCEFLGFAPEIIRPEMLDAVRIDFYAEFLPDYVSLDAYYCNAEGYSMNHFSICYYTEPDKIPYRVEENETGHFIDICGQQVYTALQSAKKVYSWRFDKGVCDFYSDAESDLPLPALEAYLSGDVLTSEAAAQLPTDATPQQIAAIIAEQETRQISTGDFSEFCDSLGFTPAVFRPEVFHAREVLYTATVMPDWTVVGALYQPEDREYNVVMRISYFASVDEVFANFEQSESGVFLNIAGTTVYCAPNLHRTAYAWVDGTVTYLLSGVLPQETTIPLLEAYLLGDRQQPGN